MSVCLGTVCPPRWMVGWLPPSPAHPQHPCRLRVPCSPLVPSHWCWMRMILQWKQASFQMLEEGMVLMALSKRQNWAASKLSAPLGPGA